VSPAAAALRSPARELLGRYRSILVSAWALRHELAGPRRLVDETAFLPAALSLEATPAHPAPLRVARVLCALFGVGLAWACLGTIDIVAVAQGRVVVSERTKTLQPLETGVVRRVLVRDGDAVRLGQVLVELDATNATADAASVREQLGASWSEALRTRALLQSLHTGKLPFLSPPPGEAWGEAGLPSAASVQAQLQAEGQDIAAKLARLGADQAHRQAEIGTVRALIAKLEATLPIARQREADFRSLMAQGFISGHAEQDRARERIELERDLSTQQARLVEAQAASKGAENARSAYLAETQRLLSERHAQAELKRQQLVQERRKADQRSRLTQLTAPVDGKVQQVGVHTEGGVVTPAQVLMVIVPRDAQVTAEVVVDNKDIGFVQVGDTARVKLETFPFTRYGTVEARVRSVSADAVHDEKRGAIFPAVLTIGRASIEVEGKRIDLSPGMNVTAEIRTGERRVIDYLLSPVQKSLGESLRER
jgi:hemolysin D